MHKHFHKLAIAITCLVSLLATAEASAMLNPRLGQFMQRDPGYQPRGGVQGFAPRVGQGYQDGMNQYAAHFVQKGGLDPMGNVVIFVHGINNTNDAEVNAMYDAMKGVWGEEKNQSLVHFRYQWFGTDTGPATAVLGRASLANFRSGRELARLLKHLNSERDRIRNDINWNNDPDCDEPIYLIGYSNGGNVIYHALSTFGASADRVILVGSSLDDGDWEINTPIESIAGQSGEVLNFWGQGDNTANLVDGIGAGESPLIDSQPGALPGDTATSTPSVNNSGNITSVHIPSIYHSQNTAAGRGDNWLTPRLVENYYAGPTSEMGGLILSRNGTLPGGQSLEPNKIFRHNYEASYLTQWLGN